MNDILNKPINNTFKKPNNNLFANTKTIVADTSLIIYFIIFPYLLYFYLLYCQIIISTIMNKKVYLKCHSLKS